VTLLLAALVMLGAGVFGMLGLGGGVFYVPLFSWWGMEFRDQAVPASLFLGCLTGAFPVAHYLRARLVHLPSGGAAVAGALAGAPLGAVAVRHLPVPALKLIFACAVLFTAARILLSREQHPHRRASAAVAVAVAVAAGLLAGFASGLLGIGGGFVMLPVLLVLGFPTREAVATSSLVVAFSAAAAFIAHLPTARIDWPQLVLLGAAAAAGGSFAGWFVAHHARPHILRLAVGGALLLVAARVLWEGMRLGV
jgi:uncharacterized membrane protein YfcA